MPRITPMLKTEPVTEELPYEDELPTPKSKAVPSGGFLTALLGASLLACLPPEKKEQLDQLEKDHENINEILSRTGKIYDEETAKLDEFTELTEGNPFLSLPRNPAVLPQIEERVNQIMTYAERVKEALYYFGPQTSQQIHDKICVKGQELDQNQMSLFMSGITLVVDSGEVAVTWSPDGEVKYALATNAPSRPIQIKNGSAWDMRDVGGRCVALGDEFKTYHSREEQKRILEEMAKEESPLTKQEMQEVLGEDTKILTEEILQLLTKANWQYKDLVEHFQGMNNVKHINDVLTVLEEEDILVNDFGTYHFSGRIQKQQEKNRAEKKRAREKQKRKEESAKINKAFSERYPENYPTISTETAEVVTVPFGNVWKQNIAKLIGRGLNPYDYAPGPKGDVHRSDPGYRKDADWDKSIDEMMKEDFIYLNLATENFHLTTKGNAELERLNA